MEDPRQSPAQPGPRRPAAAAAGQLDAAPRPRCHRPPVGPLDHYPAGMVVGGRRAFPQAAGSVADVAPARTGRLVRTPARPGPAHLRVPAIRCLYQPRCHRSHAGALAVYSQTAPGMANRQRCRTHRPTRSRGGLRDHVDRTGRHSGLWLVAPWIAWRISQPIEPSAVSELRPKQLAFLRRTARKTWRFFETFVTAQEHWLPPDNFQEEPVPVVASRTSPTNMGLAL